MRDFLFKFNKLSYACWAVWAIAAGSAGAEEVEFDERFLGLVPGQPTADMRKYRFGNPIPAGQYNADVYVNGELYGNTLLKVVDQADNPLAGLCLSPSLAEVMSLKDDAFATPPSEQNCVSTLAAIPEAKIQFETEKLALNVEIPQILVQKRPRGYVDPSLWETGTPALFLRYNATQNDSRVANRHSQQRYVSLNTGLNAAGWAVRHLGSQSWYNHKKQPYQYQHAYAQRDIDSLKSQFTFGDFYTSGYFFENFTLRGIKMESDERMIPASLRGYAPRIEGVARSNAQIIVRQDGYVIYETNVPAGAFSIDDLYPVGYSGKLEVEIIEADGQRRRFSVPFSNAVRLLRVGQWRYRAAAGRYREGSKVYPDALFQGELSYGLFNGLTLNTGIMANHNYLSGLAGVAFDTPLGAFSSHFVHSRAKFPHLNQQVKYRAVNLGYNARLQQFGSYFSASLFRAFSANNYSLAQILAINRAQRNLSDDAQLRQQIALSFSQSLGERLGSLSLSGIRSQFWNRSQAVTEYQFNYSNAYQRLQYQLGYSMVRDPALKKRDKRFYLNASMMLGSELNSPVLYGYYQQADQSRFMQSAVGGSLGQDSQFNYHLAASHQSASDNHYSLNLGYRASAAKLNANLTKSGNSRQTGLTISGALVAHQKGLTLSNDLGETFAIIHAKDAQGAKINNGNGGYLDWLGNGIVPYVSPYQKNYVGIDPTAVSNDVEIENTGLEIVPRANSAVLVQFATKSGQSVLFDVTLPDGTAPPLAAEVFDEQEQLIGYVAQGGRVFVRGISPSGKLSVIWGEGEQDRCQFSYQLNQHHHTAYAVQCLTK